jgi:hypothetical protein
MSQILLLLGLEFAFVIVDSAPSFGDFFKFSFADGAAVFGLSSAKGLPPTIS